MDRSTRNLRSALSVVAVALGTVIPAVVFAQQGLKEQIVGTWTPVSQYVDQDGKRLEPFGPESQGDRGLRQQWTICPGSATGELAQIRVK